MTKTKRYLLNFVLIISLLLMLTGSIMIKTEKNVALADGHIHDGMVFQPWYYSDDLPDDPGNYYLTSNVTLTRWVPSGTIRICLNGFKIFCEKGLIYRNCVIVECNSNVYIYDDEQNMGSIESIDDNLEYIVSVEEGGRLYLNGGTMKGAGIILDDDSSAYFEMNGGTITSCTQSAVYVQYGRFRMNGGTICDNTNCGVELCGYGIFEMYGGTITHNNSVGVSSSATFIMRGGTISENRYSGVTAQSMTMVDGTIQGNNENGIYVTSFLSMVGGTITSNGGNGVYSTGEIALTGGNINNNGNYGINTSGVITIKGGTITENILGGLYCDGATVRINGNPKIYDNTSGRNLILSKGKTETFLVNDPMTDGANIGVTLLDGTSSVKGVVTSYVEDGILPATFIDYFHADDEDFIIVQNGNILELVTKHLHTANNGTEYNFLVWTDSSSLPTTQGNYYLNTDITLRSKWSVPTGTTRICCNGHKIIGAYSFVKDSDNCMIKLSSMTNLELFNDNNNGGLITSQKEINTLILVNGADLYLDDITISCDGSSSGNSWYDTEYYWYGIRAYNSNITVDKCSISGFMGAGIYGGSGTQIYVENTSITACGSGGGIRGGICSEYSTLTLADNVEITNNTEGVGVNVWGGSVEVCGKVVIKNNTYGNLVLSNYIDNNQNVIMPKISINDDLSADTKIGVTLFDSEEYAETSGIFTTIPDTLNIENYINCFFSDNENFRIKQKGTDLELVPYNIIEDAESEFGYVNIKVDGNDVEGACYGDTVSIEIFKFNVGYRFTGIEVSYNFVELVDLESAMGDSCFAGAESYADYNENVYNFSNRYVMLNENNHFALYENDEIITVLTNSQIHTPYSDDYMITDYCDGYLWTFNKTNGKISNITIAKYQSSGDVCYFASQDDQLSENKVSLHTIELTEVIYGQLYRFVMPDFAVKVNLYLEDLYDLEVVEPVAIENLAYTGEELNLITDGEVEGGFGLLAYKLDDGEYSYYVPKAILPGTYTIKFKGEGDTYHKDYPEKTIIVEISKATLTDVSVVQAEDLIYDGNYKDIEVNKTATSVNGQQVTFTFSTTEDNYGDMPSFADAGEYTIYFKASADYHFDYYGSFVIAIVMEQPVLNKLPSVITGLEYTGELLDLITGGEVEGGTILYKLDDEEYSQNIPGAILPGSYTYYKLEGYKNYTDIEEESFNVVILNATLTNVNVVQSDTLDYNGQEQTPTIQANAIAVGEQEVTFTYCRDVDGTYGEMFSFTDAGTYNVFYKATANYHNVYKGWFAVTINKIDSEIISLPTAIENLVYTGNEQVLINGGEASGGTIKYQLDNGKFKEELPSTALGGTHIVYYKVEGDNNHNNTERYSIEISIINAEMSDVSVEQAGELVYNRQGQTVTVNTNSTTIGNQETVFTYSLIQNGTYGEMPLITNAGTYTIFFKANADYHNEQSGSFEVVIDKADVEFTAPTPKELTYTGSEQVLINAGMVDDGTMLYKLGDGEYGETLPKATLSGTYIVYYIIQSDNNHNNIEESDIVVTISQVDKTGLISAKDNAVNYYNEIRDYETVAQTLYGAIADTETIISDANVTENVVSNAMKVLNSAVSDAKLGVVIEKIDSIGQVVYTESCKQLIDEIRTLYDALTILQKQNVTNYDKLTEAETIYAKLLNDYTLANVVIEQINNIGEITYVGLKNPAIESVREAYNNLTEEQKQLVGNYEILTSAETTYIELKTINEVTTLTDAETGVRFEINDGKTIPDFITLKVDVKTDATPQDFGKNADRISELVVGNDKIYQVYNIRLVRVIDGVETELQPQDIDEGMVITIRISVPKGVPTSKLKILHIHAQNDIEYIENYTIENEEIVFNITRLSEFALINKKSVNIYIVGGVILAVVILSVVITLVAVKSAKKKRQ